MQKHLHLILLVFCLLSFSSAYAEEDPAAAPETSDSTDDMSSSKLSLFPILPRGAIPGAIAQIIPISNNHALGGVHKGLTRIIIAIHDASRNSQGLVTDLETIGGAAADQTLILAPQFLAENDPPTYYPDMPDELRKTLAVWQYNTWADGGGTKVDKPMKPISSFTVMDLLLLYLGERNNFPDLKDIYVVGHGSGADFAQRYAMLGMATNLLEREGIAVHFVLANTNSYLYVTAARPKLDSQGFATPKLGLCLTYNYYKYGLEYLNPYGKSVGENAIKSNYGDRRVTYLVGENIAMLDPAPDMSCQSLRQGPNRFARAQFYYRYVYQLYGDAVTKRQKAYAIPKTAYNLVAMLGSQCGKSILFSDGSACDRAISLSSDILQ